MHKNINENMMNIEFNHYNLCKGQSQVKYIHILRFPLLETFNDGNKILGGLSDFLLGGPNWRVDFAGGVGPLVDTMILLENRFFRPLTLPLALNCINCLEQSGAKCSSQNAYPKMPIPKCSSQNTQSGTKFSKCSNAQNQSLLNCIRKVSTSNYADHLCCKNIGIV